MEAIQNEEKQLNHKINCSDFGDDDVISFTPSNAQNLKTEMVRYGQIKDVLEEKSTALGISKIVQQRLATKRIESYTEYSKYSEANQNYLPHTQSWLVEGIECETLKVGAQQWEKGHLKMTISLEFVPESVEEIQESEVTGSSLDELRQLPH